MEPDFEVKIDYRLLFATRTAVKSKARVGWTQDLRMGGSSPFIEYSPRISPQDNPWIFSNRSTIQQFMRGLNDDRSTYIFLESLAYISKGEVGDIIEVTIEFIQNDTILGSFHKVVKLSREKERIAVWTKLSFDR